MSGEVDLSGLERASSASVRLAARTRVRGDGAGEATEGFSAFARVYVEVVVSELRGASRDAAVAFTVEQSDDGDSWEAAGDPVSFSSDGRSVVAVDGPSDWLRVSWAVTGLLRSCVVGGVVATPGSLDAPSSPSGGSQPGVWKEYGVDSASDTPPITGATVGNGTMVGRWWTPAPVVPSDATDPFLCQVELELILGSTSSIDGVIGWSLPRLVDGSGFDIVDAEFNLGIVAGLTGGAVSPGFIFGGIGPFVSPDGTPFDATHPFVWAEGDLLAVSITFRAKFAGD